MKQYQNKLIIAVLISASLLTTSCEDIWNRCVDGNGDRRIETRALQEFTRIEINGEFEVQIDTELDHAAVIEADENLIDLIVTHVSGSTLIIETRNGTCIRPSRPVEITVSTEFLDEISLNGSGYAYCYSLETEDLSAKLAGSGQIDLNNAVAATIDIELEGSGMINCTSVSENISATLEGSGEIGLEGSSVSSEFRIIGSGKIKARELNTDVCVAYISGSGITDTWVNNALDVTIIGSGIVYYTGNPVVESYISGSGEVRER